MRVPGETTAGWYDDRPERALNFLMALSQAIDVAVVFLDVMPPAEPLPPASPLPPILVRVTTPNDLASQRFLALIQKVTGRRFLQVEGLCLPFSSAMPCLLQPQN